MPATWDERLITRGDAADLVGEWPVAWHVDPDSGHLVLRCKCKQSCGLWTPGAVTTNDDMIAAILRHLVMAHDLPLNKAARERMTDGRARNSSANAGTGAPGSAGDTAPAPAPGAVAGSMAHDPGRSGADEGNAPDTNADRSAGE